MSVPTKIEVAFNILNYLRAIEIGPVPAAPGLDWKPEYGRELTKAEARLKDHTLAIIELYFSEPGFGDVAQQEEENPFATMIRIANQQHKPPPPPAAPPGPTVPAPEPPPEGSGDSEGTPKQPAPEKKPEDAPPEKVKA